MEFTLLTPTGFYSVHFTLLTTAPTVPKGRTPDDSLALAPSCLVQCPELRLLPASAAWFGLQPFSSWLAFFFGCLLTAAYHTLPRVGTSGLLSLRSSLANSRVSVHFATLVPAAQRSYHFFFDNCHLNLPNFSVIQQLYPLHIHNRIYSFRY